MTIEEKKEMQKKEREECLNKIIKSKSAKKIIVAGAGTGKTYTFKKILEANPSDNNIVLTFIRMLTEDMYKSFGDLAEVKTFHAYCKKILHERNGKVDLFPLLTKIIEEDAVYLENRLSNFDEKFQKLDDSSDEITFYLKRGDYYDSVSFNDSVYRLYSLLKTDKSILPQLNQILIDEFQDFNPLEVAFISELEKKGTVLIVGDDDQSVYEGRCASPTYLREKYNSAEYEKFILPYCSRCTEVIVSTSNAILKKANDTGHLKNRIEKRHESFIESKNEDSSKYPKIITVQCSLGKTIAKYIKKIIAQIRQEEIEDSWNEDNRYPTLLIVGQKQYLKIVYENLKDDYPQIEYKQYAQPQLTPILAYELLIKDINNNLGWRILTNFFLGKEEIKKIIVLSEKGKLMTELLSSEFIENHKKVIEIIKNIQNGNDLSGESLEEFTQLTNNYHSDIIEYFKPKEEEQTIETDKSKPSILLTSFVGCKGLSGGFTIIIGANNGSIPNNPRNISDIEISQFIVALTRTRKQCYIISNKWLIAPVLNGKRFKPLERSVFLSWIPRDLIRDEGELKAKDIVL